MTDADAFTSALAVVIAGWGWVLFRVLRSGVFDIRLGFGPGRIEIAKAERPLAFAASVSWMVIFLVGAILAEIYHVSLHYL